MSFHNRDRIAAEEIHIPADIDWQMLDKSKFFILGAALFSAVSAALYPMIVLKTRQQVHLTQSSTFKISSAILKHEGLKGFYRGFGTSLMGTIPARAVYMTALEVTKSGAISESCKLGFSNATSIAIANVAGGLSSAMAAQLVWTPVDVVSQRLMVQNGGIKNPILGKFGSCKYSNGIDAFRKIVSVDGVKGLYRGFGISMLAYAPSNALWWGSYSLANRLIWESQVRNNYHNFKIRDDFDDNNFDWKKTVVFQGMSASIASGVSALITMPLDTIKTRMQVLDHGEGFGRRTIAETVRDLVREGGFGACYRGLGPRWATMSMSATTMITTYELLKRLSTKN